MFDLITDKTERPLRHRSLLSRAFAITAHVIVILVVVVIPLLRATNELPPVMPTMLAFVAPAPTAPPPPPPPPAPAPAAPARAPQPAHTAGQFAAPVEAPSDIRPEPPARPVESNAGVLGGVEGGVPGGVVGGVVGGLVSAVPPPPPPAPAAPPPPRVVRIGGQITAPALIKRVEPIYPDVAALAQLSGVVILEATVGTDGCVQSVKLLRSRHPLLDKASEEALMQWQYSPLVLNGIATSFVLTVTFHFSVR